MKTQATSLPAASQHLVMALYGDDAAAHLHRALGILDNAGAAGGRGKRYPLGIVLALRDVTFALSTGDTIHAARAARVLRSYLSEEGLDRDATPPLDLNE